MHKIKTFLLKNGPLLATVVIFILIYVLGGHALPGYEKTAGIFQLIYQ